jgi:hypothetical protein
MTSLTATLAEILTMRESGCSEDDIKAILREKFSRPPGDLSGPRYRCMACEDSGYRYVASTDFVKHIHEGGSLESWGKRVHLTAVIRCDCGRIKRSQDRPSDTVFNMNHFCPLPKNCLPEKVESEVRDWFALYSSPAKRGNQVLAGFNSDGA